MRTGNFCQTSQIILLRPKSKKVPGDHKPTPHSGKQNKTLCFDFPQGGPDFYVSRIWLQEGKYKHTMRGQNTKGRDSVCFTAWISLNPESSNLECSSSLAAYQAGPQGLTGISELGHQDWDSSVLHISLSYVGPLHSWFLPKLSECELLFELERYFFL